MQGAGAPRSQGPSAAQAGPWGRPWVLLLTYVLVSVEFTCLFMQFSILPYLSRKLGLDSVAFGYLQTTFGVLQLLGGPVFGRFADQRGARAAFTVSFLAASALHLLLTAACSPALPGLALLFASRLPGLFTHILPAAQMVVVDLSAPEERPAALGRLGLCFGIGIIFGSLLGGTLSTAYGIQYPPFVAFVANLLGAALSFTFIPASTKGAGAQGQATPPGGPQASVFDLKAISRLLLQPGVLPVFLVKVISGFPSGLFMVMSSIISMDFFQLEAAQAGYVLSFFGLLQMALMSNIFHYCLLLPGLVFSLCTLNVVTDSILTKAVAASDTGAMLGLCATVQPLTRTLGPIVGGLLYRSFGVSVFGHIQFAVNFLVFLVLWKQPLPHKTDKVW
ncbi:solute carrier family 22 member 18 isoform X2 [Artibeus jamaicensis]|uniref:solute carrier family 22 member 18 isoform X2 n=1 Tax=Artibeus jamaicensis TaxID=9417 RepID=UPI00235AAA8A|nr:solute carrier family 22 member 18 isoform X2 [Artibeus jamaicensis]